MALLAERTEGAPVERLTSEDSFIATGPAYAATMPSADSIFIQRHLMDDRGDEMGNGRRDLPGRGTTTRRALGTLGGVSPTKLPRRLRRPARAADVNRLLSALDGAATYSVATQRPRRQRLA